jgi:hypothetical protein
MRLTTTLQLHSSNRPFPFYPSVAENLPEDTYACQYVRRTEQVSQAGEFFIGSDGLIISSFIPSRGRTRLDVCAIGDASATDRVRTAMLTFRKPKTDSMLEAAIVQLYPVLPTPLFGIVYHSGDLPFLMVLTRDVQVYPLILFSENHTTLVFSNSPDLDTKLSNEYKTAVSKYRMPVLLNGIMLVPTNKLVSRVVRWRADHMQSITLANAVESTLYKNWRTDNSNAVNN